jgi:hypothetical protein
VQDSWKIKDVDVISGPPWTSYRVKEWIVYGLGISIYAYVIYDRVYYDVVYGSLTCFFDGYRLMIAC